MDMQNSFFGHYRIFDRIGRGATSDVFRASDTRNNEKVALKVLMPFYETDEQLVRRFVNEGVWYSKLQHQNIVKVFESGAIDNRLFIAMELVEGGSLADTISKQGNIFLENDIFLIINQMAQALDYAHSLNIIHRDIKPSNILSDSNNQYLLSDFGAAKQLDSNHTVLTQTGMSLGTPAYMSPEQARGDSLIDFRSDIYSLGVIAYQLLAGRLPFSAPSTPTLVYKIVHNDPSSPRKFNKAISPWISSVLKKVLSKEPDERYSEATTFALELMRDGSVERVKKRRKVKVFKLRGYRY